MHFCTQPVNPNLNSQISNGTLLIARAKIELSIIETVHIMVANMLVSDVGTYDILVTHKLIQTVYKR